MKNIKNNIKSYKNHMKSYDDHIKSYENVKSSLTLIGFAGTIVT